MDLREMLFWFFLTIFGTGTFVIFEQHVTWGTALILVGLFGIVGCAWPYLKDPITGKFQFTWERLPRSTKVKTTGFTLAVALLLSIITAVYRHHHKNLITEANPFKATIKFIRTDWGQPTPAHLVVYYVLNDVPTASPLDIIIYFRIINTTSGPLYLEAWSVETAPKANGPWVKLSYIPASPHLSIYIVDSINNHTSRAVIMPDLTDSLAASPIQPQKEVDGWTDFECPSSPPCLGWYQRIVIRDTQGHTYSQILDLSDYNTSLELQSVPAGMMKSRAPALDLTNVPLLRPYPKEANRTDPNDETDVARLTR